MALLLALALVGYAKRSLLTSTTILGTWALVDESSSLRTSKYYDFRKDGGFECVLRTDFLTALGGTQQTAEATTTGTYRLQGDLVMVVIKDIHFKVNGVEQTTDPHAFDDVAPDKKTEVYKLRMAGDAIAFQISGKKEHIFHHVSSIPPR